jgi:heat shock protein HslJ
MYRSRIPVVLVLLVALAGCGQKEEAADRTTAPTLDELKNATYMGVGEQDSVTLKDGLWEGEPAVEGGASRPSVHFVRDFHLMGDLDGDGLDEAAVLLGAGSGGTGVNNYLAVVGIRDGKLENLDTVLLGDRVQVRKAGILEGRVFVDVLRAGPQDAMCCPGELAVLAWSLKNGKLEAMEATSEPLRLSLESIGETEWVLRWWDWEEPVPPEPQVTLFFKDGRLGGTSGCNNYFAAANIGEQPGDFSMGQAGGTMMMCPDEIMAVEQRFLAQMGGANKFGFVAGMLAISYGFNGDSGVMLFEGRKPQE